MRTQHKFKYTTSPTDPALARRAINPESTVFHCLVYISEATESFETDDLQKISLYASRRNSLLNITGMLLYSGRYFIQVLEGDTHAIDLIFDHISDDERHTHIEILLKAPITNRSFQEWYMGVLDLSGHRDLPKEELRKITEHLHPTRNAAGQAALTLLKSFRSYLPDPTRIERDAA